MNLKKHLTSLSVFTLILAFVAYLTGCASTDMTGNRDATKVTMPSSGKAKVVFARFGSYGGAMGFSMHDGNRLIGVLGPNSYFTFECEPGRHQFSSTMEDVAMLDADLLPGRIYYVKVSAAMGMWIAQVNMYSLHPGCAGNLWPKLPKMLSGLRETAISPQLIAHDQTGAAKYWERVQKYHELKYLPNASREQILPEHGQLEPVHR